MFDRPFGKAGDGFPSYTPDDDDPWSGVLDQTGPTASNRVVIIHDDPPEPGGGDNDDGNGSASGRPGTGSGREGDKEHPVTDDENDDWFEDLFDNIFDFLGGILDAGDLGSGIYNPDWGAFPGAGYPWDPFDRFPPPIYRPPNQTPRPPATVPPASGPGAIVPDDTFVVATPGDPSDRWNSPWNVVGGDFVRPGVHCPPSAANYTGQCEAKGQTLIGVQAVAMGGDCFDICVCGDIPKKELPDNVFRPFDRFP